MSFFYEIIPWTLRHEVGNDPKGGYNNNPNDPGGATRWGISTRFLKTISKDPLSKIPVKNLTKDQSILLYKKYFWDASNIEALGERRLVCFRVFDIGINVGMKTAIIRLQRAFNRAYGNPSLVDDGMIGPKTARIINLSGESVLTQAFQVEMEIYYRGLAKKSAQMRTFLKGWLGRLYDTIPVAPKAPEAPHPVMNELLAALASALLLSPRAATYEADSAPVEPLPTSVPAVDVDNIV